MRFRNEFLDAYMEWVDETESPRVFHIWSALSGVAASLGRRVYLPFGIGNIYPNLYVLLVGPPAVKKSTALGLMKRLVISSTGVRLAPEDTGGQRQGLLAALHHDADADKDLLEGLEVAFEASAEGLLEDGNSISRLSSLVVDTRDKYSMFAIASEFSSFIGINNSDMLTFLVKMFDGEDYKYKLKNTEVQLKDPLLNIIGGTTPTSIAESMPAAAIGHGFMSRVILVHSNAKHKLVPRPKLKEEMEEPLKQLLHLVFNNFEGPVSEHSSASKFLDELYDYDVGITDPRFVYYIQRRHIHLIKLSMVLAASRISTIIEKRDVEDAHSILQATEVGMSDALGEYGLSPLAASKQRLIEFIIAAKAPIGMNILWAVMHREMKRIDFINCLADLTNAGKIMLVDTHDGPAYVAKEPSRKNGVEDLLADLAVEVDPAEVKIANG